MALIAGDAVAGTGLAGALAAAYKKAYPGAKIRDMAKGLNAQAEAIITYLLANADIAVSVAEAPGGVPLAPPGVGTGTLS
jgi:hypothetical protein